MTSIFDRRKSGINVIIDQRAIGKAQVMNKPELARNFISILVL